MKDFRVKFSNCYLQDDDYLKLFKIGIRIDPENYNILVMDNFKRTFSLLLAIQEAKLVVNSRWIKDCLATLRVPSPYLYMLRSSKVNLMSSINRAMQKPLFKGMRI